MNSQDARLRAALGMLLACLVAGCASWKMPAKILPGPADDEKPQVPTRLTALWSDTVLVEAGITGFGGRLMFYGRGEDPVKVEGELTVFAYDDTHDGKHAEVPAKKYVFRAEDLEKHYSTSTLGHSYSFWIPWDRVGGPSRQISLIARFKSDKGGGVVMSEMTKHFLPGTLDPSAGRANVAAKSWNTNTANHSGHNHGAAGVQHASHQAIQPQQPPVQGPHPQLPAAQLLEKPAAPKGLETDTITLPPYRNQATTSSTETDQRVEQMLQRINAAKAQQMLASQPTQAISSAAPLSIGQSLAPQSQVRQAAALADPAAETRTPDEIDSAAALSLAQEIRALRETLQADPSREDRSALQRPRARIAPKLPPTRDPARSPRLLGALQSSQSLTPPRDSSTGFAPTAQGVALAPTAQP